MAIREVEFDREEREWLAKHYAAYIRDLLPRERAALLDALLEAEGMEKRWAGVRDPYENDPICRGAYLEYRVGNEEEVKDAERRGQTTAVMIYVPVQQEGES